MWTLEKPPRIYLADREAIVYRILNIANNKCYIGKTTNFISRMKGHANSSKATTAFSRAIAKYPLSNFQIEILFICDVKIVDELEIQSISTYSCLAPFGYNLDKGGQRGRRHSESIEKMKKSKRLLFQDEEYKIKTMAPARAKINIPIMCVNTGQLFENQVEAAKYFSVSRASMCLYLSGVSANTNGLIFVDSRKYHSMEDAKKSQEYNDKVSLFKREYISTNRKPILALHTMCLYESISSASENESKSVIENSLYGNIATRQGKCWMYSSGDVLKDIESEDFKKLLFSISKKDTRVTDGTTIYHSVSELVRITNGSSKTFYRCISKGIPINGVTYFYMRGKDTLVTIQKSLDTLKNL